MMKTMNPILPIIPMNFLRRLLKRCLPSRLVARLRDLRTVLHLFANAAADNAAFVRHSGLLRTRPSQSSLRALLTMDYHAIEKGLALPHPRPGFGQKMVSRLLQNTRRYAAEFGRDDLTEIIRGCLLAYLDFHRGTPDSIAALQEPIAELLRVLPSATSPAHRAVISLTRQEIQSAAAIDPEKFFRSRYSIRNFAPGEIDESLIRQAVSLAQKTPSVCNRQCGRVHLVRERERIEQCLSLQGGARGFSNTVNKLLICTADISAMVLVGERNQHWIDGGLWAMSMVYALHSLGLGTCFLNWSKTTDHDAALRRLCDIPRNERVIVMIAVGQLPETLLVAESARLPLDAVLTVHGSAAAGQTAAGEFTRRAA